MAPPRKRRRVSLGDPQSMPLTNSLPTTEPAQTSIQPIPNSDDFSQFSRTRYLPKRIEEIHLQIHQQAVGFNQDDRSRLHRRQLSSSNESVVSTVNSAGSSVISTITNTIDSTSPSSAITTTSITTASGSGGTPVSNGATSTSNSSSIDVTFSGTAASRNSTETGESSASIRPPFGLTSDIGTLQSTNRTSHTTTLPPTYLATLANNNVKTITRANRPYVTTFGDGERSTICDRFGECQLAFGGTAAGSTRTAKTASSKRASHTTTNSSSQSSGAVIVGASSSPTTPTSPSSSTSSVSNSHSSSSSTSTPPPATIAGGVVGGAAGIAVILLIALVLLRWYKRRVQNEHRALPAGSSASPEMSQPDSADRSGMAQRAGLAPLASVLPPLFRHQKKRQEEPASAERGFTKVSGRKLPSAFSEGMTRDQMSNSPPPGMPLNETEGDYNNDMSFYRDSSGFYGGPGGEEGGYSISPGSGSGSGPFADPTPTTMTLSPGPQRRPTIHYPDSYAVPSASSQPSTYSYQAVPSESGAALSPHLAGIAELPGRSETPTLGRSETPSTIADNRSSRFTEDV